MKLSSIQCALPPDAKQSKTPFWIVDLPGEDAVRQLASRSVSIRCILELWSHGDNYDQFHKSLRGHLAANENDADFMTLFKKEKSFKINVETFNRHIKQSEKIDKIETMGYLPFQGVVDLKRPDSQWYYIEYYGLDTVNVPDKPFDILFGRWITDGNRAMINDISLKTRKFIGNTSMDPQLSLLMANQVMAQRGDFIFDPFVGSGSLLVAAAKFGGESSLTGARIFFKSNPIHDYICISTAYVAGTDIDFLMLHGKSKPTRVKQKVSLPLQSTDTFKNVQYVS